MKTVIVDDSSVYRAALSEALKEIPGVEVVKALGNGKMALDYLNGRSDIDLLTLDLEMPVLNGIETLKEIRKTNSKIKIIIFSAISENAAGKTIEALSLGANDFVTKIEGSTNIAENIEMIKRELLPRINALCLPAGTDVIKPAVSNNVFAEEDDYPKIVQTPRADLIVIASSTGGPDALMRIFKKLSHQFQIPISIVQHMPPIFTQKLAQTLTQKDGIKVFEASEGMKIEKGCAYIAPGNFHMKLKRIGNDYQLTLNQEEKVCHVRPSADVLFKSVAENYRLNVACSVLTGMGEDGKEGAKSLAAKETPIFYQNKDSSVVWGMPGAIFKSGIKATPLALDDIGDFFNKIDLFKKGCNP